MSARWRRHQMMAATREEAGNSPAASNTIGLDYEADFPGPQETRVVDAANRIFPHSGQGSIKDLLDYEENGQPGMTKAVYSIGVVEPTTVDAHDLNGEQAIIRRLPDTNYGPVGTSDHNSLLGILYAMQETGQYFPNETSQADMIKAV